MVKPQTRCGLKGCDNHLGPGAADVGYEHDGKTKNVRCCSACTWKIMTAPRGTFVITKDKELKPIPAKRIIIP